MKAVFSRNARYPDLDCWLILVGSLDIMLTSVILWTLGGKELNPIAATAANAYGIWGLITLKFATLIVVIAAAEAIGQTKVRTGQQLMTIAIAISCVPVIIGASLTAAG